MCVGLEASAVERLRRPLPAQCRASVYVVCRNDQPIYKRNAICCMSSQILNGEPLTIFGDGSQTRAFSYDSIPPIIAPRALQHASPLKPAMQHGRG